MTTRRQFITTMLGGAAPAWSVAAHSQQAGRMRRVGMLTNLIENDREALSWMTAFRQQLEREGWTEGRNIRFDVRWGAGDLDRVRRYAAELVSLTPDAAFGDSTPTIAALQKETHTIPIVFVGGSDPVGSGFVTSLARPGGNITGFISFEPAIGGKWLQTLSEIAPGVTRVALIYNPRTHTGQYFQSIETAAQLLAVNLSRLPFSDAADIERGLDSLAREPNGGVLVLSDPSTQLHLDLIITLAAKHRLPAVYPFRWFVTRGGLVVLRRRSKGPVPAGCRICFPHPQGGKANRPASAGPTKLTC